MENGDNDGCVYESPPMPLDICYVCGRHRNEHVITEDSYTGRPQCPKENTAMTRDDFEAILDATPMDWHLRLVYADWLEEQGDTVAANGQRWQAKERKRASESKQIFTWFEWGTEWHGLDYETHVPSNVFCRLLKGSSMTWADYPSRHEAEADLAQALAALELRQTAERVTHYPPPSVWDPKEYE